MICAQRSITLRPRPRGFHVITHEVEGVLAELPRVAAGVLHVFIQHTSASLALGENASPDVRADLEAWTRRAVPDDASYFTHTDEGPDDMSAHVKAILVGPALALPVTNGRLALGTWQGVYLGEHRDSAAGRRLVFTLIGA